MKHLSRRRFLNRVGAGLVIAGGARLARGADTSGLLPGAASAVLESGALKLHATRPDLWEGGGVSVHLSETDNVVRVTIEAPRVALRAVILSWPQEQPQQVLNDHWERTYGDVAWQPPSPALQMPWYFLASYSNTTRAYGVRTGGAALCSWQLADGLRRLSIDTTSGGVGVQLGTRTLVAADIVAAAAGCSETSFELLRRFTRSMCANPRLAAAPVYGINDWYFAYGKNSGALIRQHTELLAPFTEGLTNRPFSVIDAGWFTGPPSAPDDCCFGANMDTPNARFRDMGALANDIRKLGMRPGLWTRPLCATAADKPSLLLPRIAHRDDPARPVFDPTIPENLERVASYFSGYRRWGYDLVKIDFTTYDILGKWGFEMLRDRELTPRGWRTHDVSRTNAEIIRDLYATMRRAAGETCLIGCNTISHLSAGVFEVNRIGDDTSGKEWDRTRKMGVNALAFRGAQHGTCYAADADCVGLTPQVPWAKNRQWMELVARSGTPLFISAQPEAVGAEQRPVIRECFELASRTLPLGEPVDWMTDAWPRQWKLNGATASFDW